MNRFNISYILAISGLILMAISNAVKMDILFTMGLLMMIPLGMVVVDVLCWAIEELLDVYRRSLLS